MDRVQKVGPSFVLTRFQGLSFRGLNFQGLSFRGLIPCLGQRGQNPYPVQRHVPVQAI